MKTANRLVSIFGVLIFSIGAFMGIVLEGSAVWGDLEAFMFVKPLGADKSFKGLSCPVMISENENSQVTATLKNATDQPIQQTIRTHLSSYYTSLVDQVDTKIPLEPGEEKEMVWPINPDDALYGRFYLVRVYAFATYKTPSREGSCGVMVVSLPYTGRLIVTFLLIGSILGMVLGIITWVLMRREMSNQSNEAIYAMGAMAGIVLIGIFVSFVGWWFAGMIILILIILMAGSMIARYLLS